MGKTDAPLSFADLIEQAQRQPAAPLGNATADISSPFAMPVPGDHRVVDLGDADPEKIPNVAEYNYDAHVGYFLLPRDIAAYEDILNKVLKAKAILRYEDRSFTKDGDCIVTICYLTYTARRRNEGENGRD